MKELFGLVLRLVGGLLCAAGVVPSLIAAAVWFSRPWHHHFLWCGLLIIPGIVFQVIGEGLNRKPDAR